MISKAWIWIEKQPVIAASNRSTNHVSQNCRHRPAHGLNRKPESVQISLSRNTQITVLQAKPLFANSSSLKVPACGLAAAAVHQRPQYAHVRTGKQAATRFSQRSDIVILAIIGSHAGTSSVLCPVLLAQRLCTLNREQ